MYNSKTLNYPGVLRAFNKIEETPEIDNKFELLSSLSTLIDRAIQKDLSRIKLQNDAFSISITASDEEIRKLLVKLEESKITLYEGIANEDALITKNHYRFVKRRKYCSSKRKANTKFIKNR